MSAFIKDEKTKIVEVVHLEKKNWLKVVFWPPLAMGNCHYL